MNLSDKVKIGKNIDRDHTEGNIVVQTPAFLKEGDLNFID